MVFIISIGGGAKGGKLMPFYLVHLQKAVKENCCFARKIDPDFIDDYCGYIEVLIKENEGFTDNSKC